MSGQVCLCPLCRNRGCDNADGTKGVCAPGDTPDYCIACDDGRGGYAKPCPWPNDSCTCKSGLTAGLTHPVDILKDLGVKFSPEQEANARDICDREVE